MGAQTGIEWTDATWTPIRARLINRDVAVNKPVGSVGWHCEHVSEGCRNCYAETMNRRLGTGLDFKPGHRDDIEIFLDERMLMAPLRWREPKHIFVNSMTDIGASFVTDAILDRIFAVMALASRHTFQILTKRPERMREYMIARRDYSWAAGSQTKFRVATAATLIANTPEQQSHASQILLDPDRADIQRMWPLPNVWLGTSCEDQETADERVPDLLATPAAVRFISYEPALGPVDLTAIRRKHAEGFMRPLDGRFNKIDWVICGGESGPHARPMRPDWARSMRDQCAAAGVKFFFKQNGEWLHESQMSYVSLEIEQFKTFHTWPDDFSSVRVGKKAAGRLLDGRENNEFPEVRS